MRDFPAKTGSTAAELQGNRSRNRKVETGIYQLYIWSNRRNE